MQNINVEGGERERGDGGSSSNNGSGRTASLNHILTNIVVLQEFVLELVAVLQVRAAVLGDKELRLTAAASASA